MNWESILLDAIKTNDLARVRRAIGGGVDLTKFDDCGTTPLVLAVRYNQLDIVQELCMPEIINRRDYFGRTALWVAVHEGYLESVKVLLKISGIDVETYNGSGATALIVTAYCNNFKIANELLAAGADVNGTDFDGRTPLHAAGNSFYYPGDHYEVVHLLLRHGADPNLQFKTQTPLFQFSLHGHGRTVCLLIAAGANLYATYDPHKPIVERVIGHKHIHPNSDSHTNIDGVVLLYVALDDHDLSMQSIQRVVDEFGETEILTALRNKLNDKEIVATAKKQLLAEKLKWIMHETNSQNRIVDVVMSLKPLRLPTLVILEILMFDNPRLTEVPMYVGWNLIEKVVRFKFHKE